nr:MAG TPA: hypothetical protein [Caudoviricetes sp.]DAY38182.1 MAG TPA: hypothetical protein [Caudoviricetes sp.]
MRNNLFHFRSLPSNSKMSLINCNIILKQCKEEERK